MTYKGAKKIVMPTVKNVKGSSYNNKPNAGKQYTELTGKPVPPGMVIGHVTVEGQGKKQYLVPVTPLQNHYTNTEPYTVKHKPVPING